MTTDISILLKSYYRHPWGRRLRRISKGGMRVWRVAQCCDPLRLPPCRQKDPTVGEANGAGGQKESEHGRHQCKRQGDLQAALKGKAS